MYKHWENCEAPICTDTGAYEDNPNWKENVVWYAGEPVCNKGKSAWQKKQLRVNVLLSKNRLDHFGIKKDTPLTIQKLLEL